MSISLLTISRVYCNHSSVIKIIDNEGELSDCFSVNQLVGQNIIKINKTTQMIILNWYKKKAIVKLRKSLVYIMSVSHAKSFLESILVVIVSERCEL